MVRLEQCGRRLNVSSDDFCVPACCSASWRLVVIALIASLLAAIYGTQAARCSPTTQAFLVASVVVNSLGLILDGCLSRKSSLGTLIDDRPRKGVGSMLTVRLLLAIVDATIAILGVLAVTVGLPECPEIDARKSLYRALLGAAIASVALTVVFALTSLTCWCCGFTAAERKYASLDDALEANARRWTKRCRGCATMCCCAGCCGFGGGDLAGFEDTFETVGLVLAGAFESAEALHLTASDIAAGLALVRAVQKDEEREQLVSILRERKARLRQLKQAGRNATAASPTGAGSGAASEAVSIGVAAAATSATGLAAPPEAAEQLPTTGRPLPSSVLSSQAAASLGAPASTVAGGASSRHSILPSRVTAASAARSPRPSALFLLRGPAAARSAIEEERTRATASALRQRRYAQYTSGSVALDVTDPAQVSVLVEAAHYSSYALAAYGWLMYSYMRICTWPCRLPMLSCVFKVGDTVESCCKSPFCTIDHPRSICARVAGCCCYLCVGGSNSNTNNANAGGNGAAPDFSISLSRDHSNPFSAHHYRHHHGTADEGSKLVPGDICGCNEVALRHILQEALANDALARQGLADAGAGSRIGSHLVAAGFAPVAVARAHQGLTAGRRTTSRDRVSSSGGSSSSSSEVPASGGGGIDSSGYSGPAAVAGSRGTAGDDGRTDATGASSAGPATAYGSSSGGAVGVNIHDEAAASASDTAAAASFMPAGEPSVGADGVGQPGNLPARPLFHVDDVLYTTNDNTFFTCPWFVSVDRPRNALVITVRGTLSLADCITDAVAQPHSIRRDIERGKYGLDAILKIPKEGEDEHAHAHEGEHEAGAGAGPEHAPRPSQRRPQRKGPYVHGGMWQAAKTIFLDLLKHNLLEAVHAGPGARPLPNPEADKPFAGDKAGQQGHHHHHDVVARMPSFSSLKFPATIDDGAAPSPAEAEAAAVAPSGIAIAVDDVHNNNHHHKTTPLLSASNRRSTPPAAVTMGYAPAPNTSAAGVSADERGSLPSLDDSDAATSSTRLMCDGRQASLQLIVCGHSLGAGTASLLSLLLRPYFPRLRCFAYAPPGALVSPDLARVMEGWCTSVVVGKDMVPRMSLATLNGLLGEMIEYSSRCKVSKNVLMATAGVACCANMTPAACKPCCNAKIAKTCCFAACCCCGLPDRMCAGQDCMKGFDIGVGTLSPTADRVPLSSAAATATSSGAAVTSSDNIASDGGAAEAGHPHFNHPDLQRQPILASSELMLPPGTPLPPTEFAAALEAMRKARAALQHAGAVDAADAAASAGTTALAADRGRPHAESSGEDEYFADVSTGRTSRGTATAPPAVLGTSLGVAGAGAGAGAGSTEAAIGTPRSRFALPPGSTRPSIVGRSRPSLAPPVVATPLSPGSPAGAAALSSAAAATASTSAVAAEGKTEAEAETSVVNSPQDESPATPRAGEGNGEATPAGPSEEPLFQPSRALDLGADAGAATVMRLASATLSRGMMVGAQAGERAGQAIRLASQASTRRFETSMSAASDEGGEEAKAAAPVPGPASLTTASRRALPTVVVLTDGAPSSSFGPSMQLGSASLHTQSTAALIRQSRRLILSETMYVPGRVLHLVKVDTQPSDICSLACRAICGPSKRKENAASRAAAAAAVSTQRSASSLHAVATGNGNESSSGAVYMSADEHDRAASEEEDDEAYLSQRYFWADLCASIFCCLFRRTRVVYEPRWARRRNFTRILVSSHAIAHHMPDCMQLGLQSVVADITNGLAFGLDEPMPAEAPGHAPLERQTSSIGGALALLGPS